MELETLRYDGYIHQQLLNLVADVSDCSSSCELVVMEYNI